MVTEQEARDMNTAIEAFQASDAQARRDQLIIDLATAQTWYDTTILPTLTWNNTQPDTTQLRNTFDDRDIIIALITSDKHRKTIIRQEAEIMTTRIRTLKAGL